jgi:hypothetical protein
VGVGAAADSLAPHTKQYGLSGSLSSHSTTGASMYLQAVKETGKRSHDTSH